MEVQDKNAVKRLSAAPGGSKKANETGLFWDENLDMYTGGAININLYENTVGYYAGQTISGSIDVEIADKFAASELTVEFVGFERSHLDDSGVLAPLDFHRETLETVSIKTVVAKFDDSSQLYPGQYTYSFQLYLPAWLPESSAFATKKDKFFTEYNIRAQMTPLDPKLYVKDSRFPKKFG